MGVVIGVLVTRNRRYKLSVQQHAETALCFYCLQSALTQTHESGTAHISGGFFVLVFEEIWIVLDV